jgi:hypothetical protein
MWRATATAVLLALLTVACGGEPPTAEERIRAMLGEIERASRERDVATLKGVISEDYEDAHGRSQQDLHSLILYHHFRQKQIYLFTRVEELELAEPGAAELVLLAAMAGSPAADLEALRDVRTDIYRFDLELHDEDGDWRVVSADWRPAALDDFF